MIGSAGNNVISRGLGLIYLFNVLTMKTMTVYDDVRSINRPHNLYFVKYFTLWIRDKTHDEHGAEQVPLSFY